MPKIMAISDLRNKTHKIVNLCQQGEPVFITRNGEGELVVMSQALYEEMTARLELYQKLDEAEFLEETGHQGKSHSEVMKALRYKYTVNVQLIRSLPEPSSSSLGGAAKGAESRIVRNASSS